MFDAEVLSVGRELRTTRHLRAIGIAVSEINPFDRCSSGIVPSEYHLTIAYVTPNDIGHSLVLVANTKCTSQCPMFPSMVAKVNELRTFLEVIEQSPRSPDGPAPSLDFMSTQTTHGLCW